MIASGLGAGPRESDGYRQDRDTGSARPPVQPGRLSEDGIHEPTIGALLGHWAERTPAAVAISAPGREPISYRRLGAHIKAMVAQLHDLGIGQGDRVAVLGPDGPEIAIASLAAASAATCAPLNPAYVADEFDFYLSDLEAKALLIQAGLDSPARTVAQARGIPLVELSPVLDVQAGLVALSAGDEAGRGGRDPARPEDVALILHTSGTTSRPKMVPLTHANLVGYAFNIRDTYRLTEHDRCLNVMPLFHMHGLVAAVLSALAGGGSVVCTPGFDPSQFFAWVDEFHPTWYTAVPTIHQAILERAPSSQDAISRNRLRFVRSTSAALPPTVMAELERVFGVPVLESYGMTEAANQTSNPLPPARRKPGSAGISTGSEVAIMDEAGNLLPAGHTGEIVIHGASVMHGYVNNPEANAQAFVNGWFHTGDKAHLDGDGYLFVTGRIKEIINRGGEKVSPREVDEALLAHPAVAQAITFALPHPTLGEDVAAAVVLRPGASATEAELRELAFEHLAGFKVPSQIVIVDEIPRGPTGKLQRIGLHEKLASVLDTRFVAPRNPVEQALVDIWAEVLGRDHIGVDDNFFGLGGDSLRAMQVMARVREAFNLQHAESTLFEMPTVAGLASVVVQAQEAITTVGEPSIVRRSRESRKVTVLSSDNLVVSE